MRRIYIVFCLLQVYGGIIHASARRKKDARYSSLEAFVRMLTMPGHSGLGDVNGYENVKWRMVI